MICFIATYSAISINHNQNTKNIKSKSDIEVITNFQNITIGLIDLFDIDFKNNRAGVAIIINEKMRSKGFAKEALELLINDDETDCVVMIGEIGGQLEGDAAQWYKASGSTKPVVGFIAGETAPAGRTMGHAGAIVGGSDDTAQAKKRIMRECGIHVVDSPAQIGAKMAEVLAQ